MGKKIIMTNNKEIYKKLNLLNFTTEVLINTGTEKQINRIINNINKERIVLIKEKIGEYLLLKKKGPVDYIVYLKK
jgi:hypothetical protein